MFDSMSNTWVEAAPPKVRIGHCLLALLARFPGADFGKKTASFNLFNMDIWKCACWDDPTCSCQKDEGFMIDGNRL
jgi:hypothetical protein